MMKRYSKVAVIVLDSVGAGALPDAARFGDERANTLKHTSEAAGPLKMPNLEELGLGNITEIKGVSPRFTTTGWWGKAAELSVGKDTTTGHWELMGVITREPFSVWPEGFPPEIIEEFEKRTGRGVLGNRPASGTKIIEELGREHLETGKWIVYTSADSVFQIAAHEEVIPLEELYEACRIARKILDPYRVARVIARPFVGTPGNFKRTYNRKDFSMEPPEPTVLDVLKDNNIEVIGIGKIHDIFAGRGLTRSIHTEGNTDGLKKTVETLKGMDSGFLFVNLVDFDMRYGHRRNPQGYARALEEVDQWWPEIAQAAGSDALVILTADHGCDPTAQWSTDHTREYIPVIGWRRELPPAVRGIGILPTFADIGATVAYNFGLQGPKEGSPIEAFFKEE